MKTKVDKKVIQLHQSWGDIPDWTYDALLALMQSLRIADVMTYEHCLRVGESSRRLARDMGLNEYEQKVAHVSGMLHDIGKIGIDKLVLHKPSRLTEAEQMMMKHHPILSEEVVAPLAAKNTFLRTLWAAFEDIMNVSMVVAIPIIWSAIRFH